MTSTQRDERPVEQASASKGYRVLTGDQICPRCRKHFTISYWSGDVLVQARCLSCDLKWPRPDVV